jgi:hypothetical protein
VAYDQDLANRIRELVLAEPAVTEQRMLGRVMQGWLLVDADGVRTKRQLERWVARGVAYARSLPSKR